MKERIFISLIKKSAVVRVENKITEEEGAFGSFFFYLNVAVFLKETKIDKVLLF